MPKTGDQVKVTLEGRYSHVGATSGRHVVIVGGKEVSLPPDWPITVTKALPMEPPPGSIVAGNGMYFHRDDQCFDPHRQWRVLVPEKITRRMQWLEVLDWIDNANYCVYTLTARTRGQ